MRLADPSDLANASDRLPATLGLLLSRALSLTGTSTVMRQLGYVKGLDVDQERCREEETRGGARYAGDTTPEGGGEYTREGLEKKKIRGLRTDRGRFCADESIAGAIGGSVRRDNEWSYPQRHGTGWRFGSGGSDPRWDLVTSRKAER